MSRINNNGTKLDLAITWKKKIHLALKPTNMSISWLPHYSIFFLYKLDEGWAEESSNKREA